MQRRFEWTGENRTPKAGDWYVDPCSGWMNQAPMDFRGPQKFDIYRPNTQAGIPLDAICFWQDGEEWCCAMGSYSEDGVAPLGRGATRDEAERDLIDGLKASADELDTIGKRLIRAASQAETVAGELQLSTR